jgi:hypothetical protein
VLDDVERRPFLVEPARERAAPALVGLLDIDLDERAGIIVGLPRRGALARAQPDDDFADPRRLARLQRDVAAFAVALVEHAEHRDAIGHRRRAGDAAGGVVAIDRDDIGRVRAFIALAGNLDARDRIDAVRRRVVATAGEREK